MDLLLPPFVPTLDHIPSSVWRKLYLAFRDEVLDEIVPLDAHQKALLASQRAQLESLDEHDSPVAATTEGSCLEERRLKALLVILRTYTEQILSSFGPHFAELAATNVEVLLVESGWSPSAATGTTPGLYGYLDVGCGRGEKTSAIARKLGCTATTALGLDVTAPDAYRKPERDGFTYWQYDGEHIPSHIPDGSCQVVTVLMVLHHSMQDPTSKALDLDKQKRLAMEIARVLRPGTGRVVLKEHDCPDVGFGQYLDMYHRVFTDIITPERPFSLRAAYRTREGWRALFKEVGLSWCCGSGIKYQTMLDYFDVFCKKPVVQ